ncbi:hypothetical protein [Bifidobacterium dentium]|nr:hypothetical protein [Bifidobacterium dentium]MBF9704597.1 hypothetical protein [Bifidobacterium dentium]MBF9707148.1 hypothetical protein [Bifidobacterium dentium]
MTKERLGRLAQLLADTAETAATIEHIDLGEQPVTGILRDTKPNKENQ